MPHELTSAAHVGYCSHNTHTFLGTSPGSTTVTDRTKTVGGRQLAKPMAMTPEFGDSFDFRLERLEPFAILATEPVLSSPCDLYDSFDSLNRKARSRRRTRRGERPMCTLAVRGRRPR